jgi:hypothetical protein
MPPEGFYPVLDRGKFLFQFVEQHAVSPVPVNMNGADYTITDKKNNGANERTNALTFPRGDVIRQLQLNTEHIQAKGIP